MWAGGDCSAFPMPRGGDSPSVALYAYKHGSHIARNLRRTLIEGKRPKPFRFPGLGQGASIGRRTAVAELQGVEITGLLAWVIWRVLLTYYFPSWDRRLHLIADWIIWPLVGRDVVAMRVGEGGEYEVRHNVYQPAEVIVTEQRAGRYIHIIVEGEVEILHSARGHEVVLTTLGPGRPLRPALGREHGDRERAREDDGAHARGPPRPGAAAAGGPALDRAARRPVRPLPDPGSRGPLT